MRALVLVMLLCSCHGDDELDAPARSTPSTRRPAAAADAHVGSDPVAILQAREAVARAEADQADIAKRTHAAQDLLVHARTDDARKAAKDELDWLRAEDIESTRDLAAARAKLAVVTR